MAGGIRHSYGLGLDLHPNPANIGHLKANKYSHVYKDFDIQVCSCNVLSGFRATPEAVSRSRVLLIRMLRQFSIKSIRRIVGRLFEAPLVSLPL